MFMETHEENTQLNFQSILTKIMKFLDENPMISDKDIENYIIKEFNLDEEIVVELREIFSEMDSFNEKAISLDKARENGMTREGWLESQLSESIKDFSKEQQDNYLANLSKALEVEADKYVEDDEK